MLYNAQEQKMLESPPVAGQSPPFDPSILSAARMVTGNTDVPNNLLGGVAGATPWGAVAGVLSSAISSPPPSLTANVSANPSLKYGDRFVENLVGQSKAGSFSVSSGNARAEAKAEATDTKMFWIIGAIVAIAGFVFLWRRG